MQSFVFFRYKIMNLPVVRKSGTAVLTSDSSNPAG